MLAAGVGCIASSLADIKRDVAFVEVYAGEGGTSRKVREKGFVSYTVDKKAGVAQDVCSLVSGQQLGNPPPPRLPRQVMVIFLVW